MVIRRDTLSDDARASVGAIHPLTWYFLRVRYGEDAVARLEQVVAWGWRVEPRSMWTGAYADIENSVVALDTTTGFWSSGTKSYWDRAEHLRDALFSPYVKPPKIGSYNKDGTKPLQAGDLGTGNPDNPRSQLESATGAGYAIKWFLRETAADIVLEIASGPVPYVILGHGDSLYDLARNAERIDDVRRGGRESAEVIARFADEGEMHRSAIHVIGNFRGHQLQLIDLVRAARGAGMDAGELHALSVLARRGREGLAIGDDSTKVLLGINQGGVDAMMRRYPQLTTHFEQHGLKAADMITARGTKLFVSEVNAQRSVTGAIEVSRKRHQLENTYYFLREAVGEKHIGGLEIIVSRYSHNFDDTLYKVDELGRLMEGDEYVRIGKHYVNVIFELPLVD